MTEETKPEIREKDRYITDLVDQVSEITGVPVAAITQVVLRSGTLEVTRLVSIKGPNGGEDGEPEMIRVVSSIDWTYTNNEGGTQ